MFMVVCVMTCAHARSGDMNVVVLHWFKRFDFWTMCKFVCVWVDFLVRCQCQRIFVFPCRRNRRHRHRIFSSIPFFSWKKVYTPFSLRFIDIVHFSPKQFVFVWRVVCLLFWFVSCSVVVSFPNVLETKKKKTKKLCVEKPNKQMKNKLRLKSHTAAVLQLIISYFK